MNAKSLTSAAPAVEVNDVRGLAVTTRPAGPSDRHLSLRRSTRPELGPVAGFWAVAAAFLANLAFATVPTPLYRLYQAQDGFSTWMLTVIFAAYAGGVLVALWLAGHVSDWMGRRRVALVGVAAEIAAAAVFLLSPAVPALLVARLLTGIGIGLLTPTVTVWLGELRASSRPGTSPLFASTTATAGTSLGFGLGPLITGFVAARVGAPLSDPYVISLVVLVLSAAAMALTPETARRHHRRWAPQQLRLPRSSPGLFVVACALVLSAFAVFSTVIALTPTILAKVMGSTSLPVAGAATFALFGVAALAQVLTARTSHGRQLIMIAGFSGVGLTALALSVLTASLSLFVLALGLTGAGVGQLFRAAVVTVSGLAGSDERGQVLAALYLIAYVGLALPSVLVGLALTLAPAVPVIVVFCALVLIAVISASAAMARRQ